MSRTRKRKIWLVVGVLLAGSLVAAWASGLGPGFGASTERSIEGAPVRRGQLRISVIERGNLKAAASVNLKSEVEGQATILYLIEEGTQVQQGDLLCELDASELVERRVTQEISVQNSEASYIKAKQNLEIQKSQNASEIAGAERALEFARVDLEKYVQGDMPQERRAKEEEILLANEELTRAKQDLEWSEKLAARGFLENTQLEADRLAATRADINLNQKTRDLELLEQYEFPRQRSELEADLEEAARELDRVQLQAAARLVDYEADMRTSKARFDLEREKLAKLDSQIAKARMVAPVDGMVVYAQQGNGRWGNDDPIAEGTAVRERQEIITIPSAEGMIIEASLHESVLEKVRVGLPCVVSIDALPDRTFRGRVKFKAVLPDKNSWWANPDLRVYRCEIALLDTDERMRPGMSCNVEIVVEDILDTLYVPVQSVFLDGGETVCFVSSGGRYERRDIDTGQNNGKWVAIRSGLEEGASVAMSLPAGVRLAPPPKGASEEDPLRGPVDDAAEGEPPGPPAAPADRGTGPRGVGERDAESPRAGGERERGKAREGETGGREGGGPGRRSGGGPGRASG